MKIIVIGGHITPSIALIEYAKKQGDEMLFVGHKTEASGDHLSREKQIAGDLSVEYESIQPVKWNRYDKWETMKKSPLLVKSINQASSIVRSYQPDAVVGFGGYLSIPVAVAAKLSSKKLVIHEQTTKAGLANRMVAKLADVVAISYESSREFFPTEKVEVTGNLIRKEFFDKNNIPSWQDDIGKDFMLVTGGSQGSEILNNLVVENVSELTNQLPIVHQYGNQDSSVFEENVNDKYICMPWMNANDTAYAMKNARVIISRAGANTVSEIIACGKPAVLVPLRGAQQNEQWYNAKLIEDAGAGIIIKQDDLSMSTAMSAIKKILDDDEYAKKSKSGMKNESEDAVMKFYKLLN